MLLVSLRTFVRLVGVTLVLGTAVTAQAPGKETFTPQHVARLRAVTSAQISPDGKHIAYVLAVPRDLNKEKDGRAWAELHVVDAAGRSRPYLTGDINVSAVAWTLDGKGISFLAKRDRDEHTSLYVIPLDGGEARKVLSHGTSIQEYSWSPDGKQVAFLATEPESEEEKKLKDKGFNQEIYEEDVPSVRVWIASLGGEKPAVRKLNLPGSASDLHWAPRGDHLVLALAPNPLIDSRYMFRKVRIYARTGKIMTRLDNPGKLGQVAWSPDGKHIAIVSGVDRNDPRDGRLWVAPAAGGKWRDLTPDHKGHVTGIGWISSKELAYLSDEGVWTSLHRVAITGEGRETIIPTGGPILHDLTLSADGKVAAFVGDTPRHPGEVFILPAGAKKPRKLTDSNPWLANMEWGKQEVVKHKARDGLELEGILIRPPGEQKGQRYPLVLSVHGGPESHEANGWLTTYSRLGQVGAAHGFMVFYPNYRGSTGRGLAFSKMGQADAAGKEFDDLIDAVDHLVHLGLVDKDKVGITGGSYGGYATAWGSTYYSDRFAAGVMFVGISDLISKTGTTDIPYEMYLVHHRKWLWQDWDYFIKRSPIHHVEKARTPLLILHGKEDPRVHPSQSMELYRHLKVRGQAPVRLVFYPGEGHGNRRAASRLDYNLRLLRWMEHFLKKGGKKAPPYRVEYGLKEKK
jgi:dipeptidyl aminopeptidase/acylaminoacyl peptidase